jgi:EmrB/QacA subfamily drug resistance transporter
VREDLNASSSQLQWIVDSYMLVFAGILLTAGSLGDRFGRRKALMAGLVVFGAGSLVSAFSGSAAMLIGSRALMGVGAAFIMPSTLSILTNVFPARERAKAIAVWAGVSGIGIAIGPLAGGWLLTHFWWGSVFLVNIPFVVATIFAAVKLVPESRDPKTTPLDLAGATLSVAGLITVVWAITDAPTSGWTSTRIMIAFGVAIVLLAAFAVREVTARYPMLDVRLLLHRSFSAASASITLVFFALMGTIFFLTTYIQSVLGYTPLQAGVRIVPVSAAMILGAGLSTKIVARIGTRAIVAVGLALVGAALLLLAQANVDSGYGIVAAVLALMGLGMGFAMAPATDSVMSSVPLEKASVGSAMNDTTRMVGGALGVAVLGSILSSGYRGHLDANVPDAARDSLGGALHVGGTQLVDHARHAFVSGMSTASLVAGGIALAGALVAYFALPRRPKAEAEIIELAPATEALAA